jgi:hypothetical protein
VRLRKRTHEWGQSLTTAPATLSDVKIRESKFQRTLVFAEKSWTIEDKDRRVRRPQRVKDTNMKN